MPFPTYDKIEAIPDDQRDVYEEGEDKKWRAKVPDVTQLNSALEKERTDRDTEKKARTKAENDLAALRRKQAAADNNISEEQLEALRKEDEQKRKPLADELATTKAELVKVKKTDRVQRLFLDSGGMSDRLEDAMLALDRRTGLTEDGNTITVLDKDGKLTTAKVEDFLKVDFKKEKPWLYAGSGGSGSGAGGSSRSSGAADEEERPAPDEKQLDQKRRTVAGAL
jgi:hypothetical protein